MNLISKAIKRLFRIMIFKKGIYGSYGNGNKFTKGVFLEEASKVGNYNYFGPYVMINHAVLGNYCSIAPNVKIGQGVHSMNFITTYQKISKKLIDHSLKTEPAIIGNDVWCGANAVIMQGVKIGNGAIIGANSVVTKDVPDYSIVVGVPARVIKYRFDSLMIEELNKSGWFYEELPDAVTKIEMLMKSLDMVNKQ